MLILNFLAALFGAVFLLLFAVRMVRTGMERAFGDLFRRFVSGRQPTHRLILTGTCLAILLQSSAAVTLLSAGFVATGALGFLPAIAIVLGGDLGSALLIQVLSLRIDWLSPVFMMVGGWLFLKTERRSWKQAGRILIGIALILISLDLLREAVAPIRSGEVLPALAGTLEADHLTAFIIGAGLAFLMHSSVATVLTVVAIAGTGTVSLPVGAAVVLGANLGSAVIPVWLTRAHRPAARRVTLANLVLRGSAALLTLFALDLVPLAAPAGLGPGQALILLHVGFNAVVLLTLPLAPRLLPLLQTLAPDAPGAEAGVARHRSVLDEAMLSSGASALKSLRREVLRMADVLAGMLEPVMELYRSHDEARARRVRDEDAAINAALDAVRAYAMAMPQSEMTRQQIREMRALVDYAIAIEAAGDIVAMRLMTLAQTKARQGLRFSPEGRAELERIHDRVLANLGAATHVLIDNDVDGARDLVARKAEMAELERASRKAHLDRLTAGEPASLASSDIHLETAYSLKEMNSWIVSVAHPILFWSGQLLETRLAPQDAADG